MSDFSQADRYLLDQIRTGSSEGWSQLVERYEGRLLAFARAKMPRAADAEDLVQETFVSFLQGLPRFREEAGLETYLFTILRRKVITWFRGKQSNVCFLQDALPGAAGEESSDACEELAAPDPTASWYVRRDEQDALQRSALALALREIIDEYKRKLDFAHLRIVEMLFYCQLRNKDIAQVAGVSENQVALCKHRCLNEIRELILKHPAGASAGEAAPVSDVLLSRIWQEDRPSCLKRSTIGQYLLGTLDDGWRDYVSFHLDRLGCTYCRANLDDLREQTRTQPAPAFRDRIMQSTIGFLSRIDPHAG